jgi:hypothetical protein
VEIIAVCSLEFMRDLLGEQEICGAGEQVMSQGMVRMGCPACKKEKYSYVEGSRSATDKWQVAAPRYGTISTVATKDCKIQLISKE